MKPSLKVPSKILKLCQQIQKTYLNESDQSLTVKQKLDMIRKQNEQFYKDAEVIYRDTQQIKELKKQVEELDKALKNLRQEIQNQQRKEKQNAKWKWYHYPLAPIYAAWWLVKNALKAIIFLCTIGLKNLFEKTESMKIQRQRKYKAQKEKYKWNINQKQDAIGRLEIHITGYVQTKGKKYEQLLLQLEEEFEKMSESTNQQNQI